MKTKHLQQKTPTISSFKSELRLRDQFKKVLCLFFSYTCSRRYSSLDVLKKEVDAVHLCIFPLSGTVDAISSFHSTLLRKSHLNSFLFLSPTLSSNNCFVLSPSSTQIEENINWDLTVCTWSPQPAETCRPVLDVFSLSVFFYALQLQPPWFNSAGRFCLHSSIAPTPLRLNGEVPIRFSVGLCNFCSNEPANSYCNRPEPNIEGKREPFRSPLVIVHPPTSSSSSFLWAPVSVFSLPQTGWVCISLEAGVQYHFPTGLIKALKQCCVYGPTLHYRANINFYFSAVRC